MVVDSDHIDADSRGCYQRMFFIFKVYLTCGDCDLSYTGVAGKILTLCGI